MRQIRVQQDGTVGWHGLLVLAPVVQHFVQAAHMLTELRDVLEEADLIRMSIINLDYVLL